MGLVAECIDDPQPAEGSGFGDCTLVVWSEPPGFPTLTAQGGADIAAVVLVLWGLCWVGVLIRKLILQR